MTTTGFVVFAVGGGVVVIVVAVCVVLIVLLVTLALRGRGKQAAQRRAESRRDLDAEQDRALRSARELEDHDGARHEGAPRAPTHEPADGRDVAVDRAQDALEHIRERDDG
ncbi:MAG TPA: hypothetical protein VII98_05860 [Solirubrobacteraceae bacterium]